MKGKIKLIIVVSLILVAAVASVTFGVCYGNRERSDFPNGGIYFARTDSTICLAGRNENPLVTLTAFEVKKGEYKQFLSYNDITLVGEDGTEYGKKDVSVVYSFTDVFFSRFSVSIVLDINDFTDNVPVKINRVCLSDTDGKKYFNIGNIGIVVVDGSDSSDIAFGGYTQNSESFTSYTVLVSNNGKSSIVFNRLIMEFAETDLQFEVYTTGGVPAEMQEYELAAGKSVYIRVTLNPKGLMKDYPYAFIRPVLEYTNEKGEVAYAGVQATSYYNAMTDRSDIKTYLNRLGGGV